MVTKIEVDFDSSPYWNGPRETALWLREIIMLRGEIISNGLNKEAIVLIDPSADELDRLSDLGIPFREVPEEFTA